MPSKITASYAFHIAQSSAILKFQITLPLYSDYTFFSFCFYRLQTRQNTLKGNGVVNEVSQIDIAIWIRNTWLTNWCSQHGILYIQLFRLQIPIFIPKTVSLWDFTRMLFFIYIIPVVMVILDEIAFWIIKDTYKYLLWIVSTISFLSNIPNWLLIWTFINTCDVLIWRK